MKWNALGIVSVVAALVGSAQAGFVSGDLAVVRVNAALTTTLDAAAGVFIDIYSPNGSGGYTLTPHSLLLSGGSPFTLSNNNQQHDGILRQSADGQYLTIAGYNAAVGSATYSASSSTANRVIARIDSTFAANTSTVLAGDYDTAVLTSAVSADGTGFWLAGGSTKVTATGADITTTTTGGLRYVPLGGTSATHIDQKLTANGAVINDSQRNVLIADGQLYITTSSSTNYAGRGLFGIGTGLPTSGTHLISTPITNTASSGLSNGPPNDPDGKGTNWPKSDCVLLDLSSTIPGVDTAYSTGGKTDYEKWIKDSNGVWQRVLQKNVTFGEFNAMTAAVNNGVVTIFGATSLGVYQMADPFGYSTNDTPTFSNTALFAPSSGQFRGLVALVPEPASLALIGLGGAALLRRKR